MTLRDLRKSVGEKINGLLHSRRLPSQLFLKA
jgi:hypothetical protein